MTKARMFHHILSNCEEGFHNCKFGKFHNWHDNRTYVKQMMSFPTSRQLKSAPGKESQFLFHSTEIIIIINSNTYHRLFSG